MKEIKETRTEALKKYITKKLKQCCDNVFYLKATDKSPYPYIEYELNYIKSESLYQYFLTINIWDTTGYKRTEQLADELEKLLDGEYFTDNTQSLTIDLNSRNNLIDEDRTIKHIVLLFSLQYYYYNER